MNNRQTECQWTHKICHYLQRKCGCIVKVEYAGSRYVASGWPDRYICHPVWHGWLEFKSEKTIVTDLQRERMRELWIRQPGSVYVVRHGYDANYVQTYDGDTIAQWFRPEELLLKLAELRPPFCVDHRAINALQARINK